MLVTSTLPAEGKSTTSLSLARAFAVAGYSVLLIDGDLRRPTLHSFLGLDPSGSLLDFLNSAEEEPSLNGVVGQDPLCNVQVVLGKTRSATPTDQLLSSKAFSRLISGAKNTFDYIIMDSPPLMPVVDGRYLAKFADVVVMVTRWASTNQGDLRSVLTPLKESLPPHATLLGVLSHRQGRTSQSHGSYNGYYEDN